MFNFNDNDKKYIIKRVIAYVIISFLSYFLFAGCVKARIETRQWCSNSNSNYSCTSHVDSSLTTFSPPLYFYNNGSNFFQNYEQGYVLFNLIAVYGSGGASYSRVGIYSVSLQSHSPSNNNVGFFQCELGNMTGYNDNDKQYQIYSVKCPLQTTDNWYLWQLNINKYGGTELWVNRSEFITFVSEVSDANAIINANNQAIQNQINNQNTNAQAIQNAITTATNNEITVINNASAQAHQDSQAIHNDLSSDDSDDTSNRCGVLCKLKSLVNFIKPSNLIHLIVPTQEDWSSVIANANDAITNRLGVVGLVLNVFINCLNILTNNSGLTNYCINWNDIQVPNFNETIIPAGQWCIDTYFQDGVLKSFADVCRVIIGGLTCFAFLGYIQKIYKKILDIPITRDDEYEYISSSNWEMAHVDFNGDNDYQVFGRRSTTTTRKRV